MEDYSEFDPCKKIDGNSEENNFLHTLNIELKKNDTQNLITLDNFFNKEIKNKDNVFKIPETNLLGKKRVTPDTSLKDSPTNKHLTIFLVIYTTNKCSDNCEFLL